MPYFFMFLCYILTFGSSDLNCEFIRGEYRLLIKLKMLFVGSGDQPIVTLKISVTDFWRFRYSADLKIEIFSLGQNSFERIAFL